MGLRRRPGLAVEVDVEGTRRAASRRQRPRDALMAPMPATVVNSRRRRRATASPPGDTVLVLEAMKMELPVRAPRDGRGRGGALPGGELVQPGVALVGAGDVSPRCRRQRARSSKSARATACRTRPAAVADRRQGRVRRRAEPRPGYRVIEVVGVRLARSGCRRWPTPPRCSPASPRRPASATPRSCRTWPASSARDRRRRRRGGDLRRRVRDASAGATSTSRSTSRWHAIAEVVRASAARRGLRVRGYLSTRFGCPFEGDVAAGTRCAESPGAARARRLRGGDQRHDRRRASGPGCARCSTRSPRACRSQRGRAALPRHARHRARQRARRPRRTASPPSTRRPAASAAARTRRAPRATSPPRICSTCWTGWGSRPACRWTGSSPRRWRWRPRSATRCHRGTCRPRLAPDRTAGDVRLRTWPDAAGVRWRDFAGDRRVAPSARQRRAAARGRALGRPRAHEFVFARLRYDSGDWDYNPKVAANVLNSIVEYTNIPVYPRGGRHHRRLGRAARRSRSCS